MSITRVSTQKPTVSHQIYRRALLSQPKHVNLGLWKVPSRTVQNRTYSVTVSLRSDFYERTGKYDLELSKGFYYTCDCRAGQLEQECHHRLAVERQCHKNWKFLYAALGLPMLTTGLRGANGFYARVDQYLKGALAPVQQKQQQQGRRKTVPNESGEGSKWIDDLVAA